MIDLHLHSHYSDGDWSPEAIVKEAARRGVTGLALTDHNGLWGVDEARVACGQPGLQFLEGVEVTALLGESDVHVLGYADRFDRAVLQRGLATTRAGYAQRIRAMAACCREAGFDQVTWDEIVERRAVQADPCYTFYDVARLLHERHGLPFTKARKLTVRGGACYVPYGTWALAPRAAVALVHEAGGVAALAHPGTIAAEHGQGALAAVLAQVVSGGVDGIEVHHPFHTASMVARLGRVAVDHGLVATGGSDWHGPGRYRQALGGSGVEEAVVQELMSRRRAAAS